MIKLLLLTVLELLKKFREMLLKNGKGRHPSLCRYSFVFVGDCEDTFYGVCFLLMNLFPNFSNVMISVYAMNKTK